MCSCKLSSRRFPMRARALPPSEMQICTSVAYQRPWRRRSSSSSSLSTDASLRRVSLWTRWPVSSTGLPPYHIFLFLTFPFGTVEQNDVTTAEKCIGGAGVRLSSKMQFSTRAVHKYASAEYESGSCKVGVSALNFLYPSVSSLHT